ncbi:MAG: DNA-directed DNA polymerase [Desulfurococcaceae archaeon]
MTRKEEISVPFKPYFYVPGRGEHRDLFGNQVRVIYANDPADIPNMRRFYERHYEADVPYTRRFLIDKRIKNYFEWDGFTVRPAEPESPIPLRVWFLDSEMYPGERLPSAENPEQPVTAITFYDSFLGQFISLVVGREERVEKGENLHRAYLSSEQDLLFLFSRLVIKLDPDVITGWNIDFDVDYLKARCRTLNIPLDFSRCEVFDMLSGYKALYRRPHYALEDVVRYEKIGELKKVSMKRLREMSPDELARYNLADVEAIVNLDRKLNLVDYYIALKETAGMAHLRDLSASKLLDTILLRIAKDMNVVLPSKTDEERGEPYEGGLVLQPSPGLHEGVADIDINRCYPSIIRAFNISPETITTNPSSDDIVLGDIGFKRNPRGILSTMVDIIWSERDKLERILRNLQPGTEEYKRIERKRDAVKGLLNAVYGFTGYAKSRIYDVRLAKTVTKLAREILLFLINYYKTNGYPVLYADTDACFVKVPLEEAEELVVRSEAALNLYLREKYNLPSSCNVITLKMEKYAKAIYFTGVKKRYAMHVVWENGKACDYVDVTGFESERRDTPEYLQNVIKTILEMVLKREQRDKILSYLRESLEEFKRQPLDKIAISKAITKPFGEYKVKPPHVRGALLANIYLNANIVPGDRVKMLWVKRVKGIPKTDVICYEDGESLPELEIDWDKMFETTLKNKIETILAPYNVAWRDIQAGDRQGALDKWL